MKRSLKLVIGVILIASLVLAGCSPKNSGSQNSGGTNSGEKVKLRLLAYNKEETRKSYLEFLKTKLPNVEIEFQFVDLKSYDNLLKTQLASGNGPDFFEIGGSGAAYASAGYLEDLTNASYIKKYNDTGIMPYKGKVYGLPLQSWFEGIWYNKDIFKKYNLTPPKSWDEWMTIHDKLRAAGVKPQAMGAKSWEPMAKQQFGLLLNEFYSKPENKNFDEQFSAGTKKATDNWNATVKKWTETIQKGNITKDMLGIEYDQAQDEFATGKAAMWESGPWALEALKKKNPNLNIGMFPIPGLKEGTGWLIGGPGSAWAMNKNSKNKDTINKIFELTATPEAQEALIKDNFGSSFLKGMNSKLPPEYEDAAKAFNSGNVYAPWIHWPFDIAMDYGKALQDVLAGTKTVDDAIKLLDAKAEEQIKLLNK